MQRYYRPPSTLAVLTAVSAAVCVPSRVPRGTFSVVFLIWNIPQTFSVFGSLGVFEVLRPGFVGISQSGW